MEGVAQVTQVARVAGGCDLCPRRCAVDRASGAAGWCGAGPLPRVAHASLHFWEEPCLSGSRGSGTVFFSGCNMRCVFCQNHDISTRPGGGAALDAAALAARMADLLGQGAHNVNLVSPSHHAPGVVAALELLRARGASPAGGGGPTDGAGPTGGTRLAGRPTVVWNSNAYESIESLRRLEGLVDVYLPDLKYVDDDLAVRYSSAPGYFVAATAAIREMARQAGPPALDDAGLIVRGVIVRHLVLPGRAADACRALDWVRAEFGGAVLVSVMAQYTPVHRASEFPGLNRRVTRAEYERVLDHATAIGLEDGYFQDRGSASEQYIPPFERAPDPGGGATGAPGARKAE
jgi:putative pyruvate formate lyase activating enzyme